jgi:hypothetical protein
MTAATILAVAGVLAISTAPAVAVVRSAADLAADCNDDGHVLITANTQYVGGSADISGATIVPGVVSCLVDFGSDGLSVSFVNVNLRAKGNVNFNVGQSSVRADTSVVVWNSTIDMHPPEYAGGAVSIKTGCCAGSPAEANPKVTIVGSTLRGTGVELGASPSSAPNGQFAVIGSTVTATGDPFASVADITIVSNGSGGSVTGIANTFTAADGLRAATGAGGHTLMAGNRFGGVGGPLGTVLTTGSGGSCTSFLNGPAVPCT